MARMCQHLLRDLAPALARAGRRWGDKRIGIFLGTSTAGILESEIAYDIFVKQGKIPQDYNFVKKHAYDAALHVLRELTHFAGPSYVVSTACSSGAKVLGTAQRLISAGIIDAALVGGVDTLCQTTLRGFHGLGVLSPTACRPFAQSRDGISLGEGGAFMLLQREGPARAVLLGVGESSDAHHVSAPHPNGDGAFAAMQNALNWAVLNAANVDCVNAHGTATKLNDAAEAAAIHRLVGSQVPVVSTKSYTGHLLGAAGAVECAISLICLEHQMIPANLHAEPADDALQIYLPRAVLQQPVRTILSNSLAFGGNNASILLGLAQ